MPGDRNEQIVAMRDGGATLEEIGQRFGISRERVRQILVKLDGVTNSELRDRRHRARSEAEEVTRQAIREDVLAHPGSTKEQIAERLDLDARQVGRLISPDVAALVVTLGKATGQRQWPDNSILDLIRTAATYEYPLTCAAYAHLVELGEVDGPSVPLIYQRFGSWTAVCERAGVEPGRRAHGGYQSRWTDDDLVAYVTTYLRLPASAGTFGGYSDWARDTTGAPSGLTVRNRLGTWSEVKRVALGYQEVTG